MDNYIGISNDRLWHIIGVARKCYNIAKSEGFDEKFCRKMFVIGFNHDIGYEFSPEQSIHPDISAVLLLSLFDKSQADKLDTTGLKSIEAIKNHGKYIAMQTAEWRILNMADMTVDSKGKDVDVLERLKDIKSRYGEWSNQYLTSCDICYQIGLTAENLGRLS